ncbi:MAG: M1 family metallopeptidase [Ktedonobacteraceae bacterium]|nr:M1 family metallopeptidase [Ktedonobacteraceae bacterium]
MSRCNHKFYLGDDCSLHHFHSPLPRARSFELPGDHEQYAPDRPADVKHVKLVITLDFERETISGTAYTTFSALYDELTTIAFDTVELHVESVTLEGGQQLAYTTTDRKLTVTLDRPYHYDEGFTIAIVYHAKPRSGLFFVKPAPEDAARPTQAWTFGQPRYHSAWFPCHDAPNDRTTTELIVTVPAQFLTVSNGKLLAVIDNGTTKTHHWRQDVPHATYLVSLVVGDFAVIEDSYNSKPVNYYVRKDRKNDAHFYLGKTPQMMRFFSDYTGVEYPYDTYAQTVVELYTGAMEHTTATTHSFMLLLDERAALDLDYVPVVAHELAHQWFGDLVTCRDWPNAWLNEGFATYFEELWNEHDLGTDWFKVSMKSLKEGYLGEDSRYRRPVVYNVYYDQGMELFDAHIYNKGAWVLHMLRHQLGETAFRRAIQVYLKRYREKEVITADLERTLEEVTGRSLARFFQQWVYSGGYPAFEVQYAWDNEHRMARVKIKQTQKIDELTPCFVTRVDLAFSVLLSDEATYDTQIRVVPMRVVVGEDGQVEQNFYFPLESEPLMVRFDPDGWLLKTLKFERPTKMLRFQLAHDPDVLGRIEAAEALGEKSDDESFEALRTALERDPFWGVRAAVASALAKRGGEKAQAVLIQTLEVLDPTEFSRVRAAVAQALGTFQAPQQAEMARRSAQALSALLEKGDVSYKVESTAAEAMGKTRVEASIELLTRLLERPTWMYYVERGIFAGLGETGENRVVDVMTQYLNNPTRHPLLRAMAARGLRVVGAKRYLYSEEAQQRAVTALCNAVEHDTWNVVRGICASALEGFGERRAIGVLERLASRELDSGTQHSMRAAAHGLRSSGKDEEQLRSLRKDLDELREENRKLKEQVGVLEAKVK